MSNIYNHPRFWVIHLSFPMFSQLKKNAPTLVFHDGNHGSPTSWVNLEFPTWEFQWTFDLRTTRYCNTPKSQLEGYVARKPFVGRTKQGPNVWGPYFHRIGVGSLNAIFPRWEMWGNLGNSTPKQSQQRAFRDLEREINYDFISGVKKPPKKPNLPSMKVSSKMKWPNFPTKTFKQIIKFTLQDTEKEVETSKYGNAVLLVSRAMLPFRECQLILP